MATLRHAYFDSFFLVPEVVRSISLEAVWNFSKGTGLRRLVLQITGEKVIVNRRPTYNGTERARTNSLFYSILFYSIIAILFYSKSAK